MRVDLIYIPCIECGIFKVDGRDISSDEEYVDIRSYINDWLYSNDDDNWSLILSELSMDGRHDELHLNFTGYENDFIHIQEVLDSANEDRDVPLSISYSHIRKIEESVENDIIQKTSEIMKFLQNNRFEDCISDIGDSEKIKEINTSFLEDRKLTFQELLSLNTILSRYIIQNFNDKKLLIWDKLSEKLSELDLNADEYDSYDDIKKHLDDVLKNEAEHFNDNTDEEYKFKIKEIKNLTRRIKQIKASFDVSKVYEKFYNQIYKDDSKIQIIMENREKQKEGNIIVKDANYVTEKINSCKEGVNDELRNIIADNKTIIDSVIDKINLMLSQIELEKSCSINIGKEPGIFQIYTKFNSRSILGKYSFFSLLALGVAAAPVNLGVAKVASAAVLAKKAKMAAKYPMESFCKGIDDYFIKVRESLNEYKKQYDDYISCIEEKINETINSIVSLKSSDKEKSRENERKLSDLKIRIDNINELLSEYSDYSTKKQYIDEVQEKIRALLSDIKGEDE